VFLLLLSKRYNAAVVLVRYLSYLNSMASKLPTWDKLLKLRICELKELALKNSLNLSGVTKKEEILKVFQQNFYVDSVTELEAMTSTYATTDSTVSLSLDVIVTTGL
jgi:hypothetical protein